MFSTSEQREEREKISEPQGRTIEIIQSKEQR